jgi:protocatechuate 3,4-dioxygenase beta subunit
MLNRKTFVKAAGLAVTGVITGGWKAWVPGRAVPLVPAVSCVLTPEQTQGPYYIAREKVRRDIREKRPGTSLQLKLYVVDAATCKPIKNAAVDIWHCDGGGIYSGYEAASQGGAPGGSGPTDKNTFLRGIQLTNAQGLAQFQTIYPGWYRGRTVHIHVKVHLGGDIVGHVAHTGQLYFHDSLTSRVYQRSPYKSRAASRDTFNNTDGIFAQGGAQSMLSVRSDKKGGYVGTIVMGVRRNG